MLEETVVAAPSAAPEIPVVEVDRGPLVSLTADQRTEFRRTGELPEAPKPKTEAAASSSDKRTAPEAGKPKQEHTEHKAEQPKAKLSAEERIAQLESTIEKIRKGAGLDKTPKAESSPASVEQARPIQQQPQPQPQIPQEPTIEDKNVDGTLKYKTYEEFTRALARWEVNLAIAAQEQQRAQQTQATAAQAKITDAQARYPNFKEVIQPAVNAIVGDQAIAPIVKTILNDSEVFPDLIFTIGSSAQELATFVEMARTNPGKAIRYIALTESLINEELAKGKNHGETPPAKPQTAAPRPPAEVGGRAAAPPDALESAARANDFRAFKAESTRRALARMKG